MCNNHQLQKEFQKPRQTELNLPVEDMLGIHQKILPYTTPWRKIWLNNLRRTHSAHLTHPCPPVQIPHDSWLCLLCDGEHPACAPKPVPDPAQERRKKMQFL